MNWNFLSWEQFIHKVAVRFGVQPYENVDGEFAKLRHTTSIAEYQEKFEELMALMRAENQGLTERYFVNCFVGGLKDELQTLAHAVSIPRLEEAHNEVQSRRANMYKFNSHNFQNNTYQTKPITVLTSPPKPFTGTINNTIKSSTGSVSSVNNLSKPKMAAPLKKLSREEMQARRDKGLCYNCDEVYKFGHKCKARQFFMITIEEEDEEDGHDTKEIQENNEVELIMEEENVTAISLHAFLVLKFNKI